MRRCLTIVLLAWISLWPLALPARAAQPAPVDAAGLAALINGARLATGVMPLRWSDALAAAAERHSADIAATGQVAHVGSDGSRPDERIAAAGYAAYSDGLFHGENVYAGVDAAEALLEWQRNPSDQGNLMRAEFREIGAGIATGVDGRVYTVVTFGAQPNVLPVFINDDSAETGSREVTLLLTDELHQPAGEGTGVVGHVVEVRTSNEPGFTDAEWRPWAPRLPWTLTAGEGLKTVYVQFRDAAQRTTAATVSITLSAAAPTATRGAPVTAPAPPPGASPQVTPGGAGTPEPARTAMSDPRAGTPTPSPQAGPETPAPGAPPAGASEPAVAPELVTLVCALQVVAVLLTGYVILRRGQT